MNNEIKINICEIGARGKAINFGKSNYQFNYMAFEPDENAAHNKKELLKKLNFNCVEVYPVCVSEVEGIDYLYLTNHLGCSSTLLPNMNVINEYNGKRKFEKILWRENFVVKEKREVQCKRLTKYIEKQSIDLLQIDTQGTELKILKDMSLNKLKEILFIDIELVNKEVYVGQCTTIEVLKFMQEHDFSLIDFTNLQYVPKKSISESNFSDKGDLISFNGIFVKNINNLSSHSKIKLSHILFNKGYLSSSLYYLEMIKEEVYTENILALRRKIKNQNIRNNLIWLLLKKYNPFYRF